METEYHLRVVLCLLGLSMILMPAHMTTLPSISYVCSESDPTDDPVDLSFSLACSPDGLVNVTISKESITLNTIFVRIFCDCIYTDENNNIKIERQTGNSGYNDLNPFDTNKATRKASIPLNETVKAAAGYNCTIRALSRAVWENQCFRYFYGPTEPWCLHGDIAEPTTTTTTTTTISSSFSGLTGTNNTKATPSSSLRPSHLNSSSPRPSLSAVPSHLDSSSAMSSLSMLPSHLNSSSTMPSSSMPMSNTPVSTPQLQLLLYFIIIPVVLVIAIALIISPLCLIVIQRYKKNNRISSFEFDQADTFFMKNRDLNITTKKHSDTISTLTGSVITIVQSLEVHIPSTDCTSNNELPSNSNNNLSQRNDIINETNTNIKTFKEVHRTPSDNDKITASHMMEAENELQESTSFHGSPSLSSISPVAAGFNDCISCNSADSCGYIETTATKLSSSQFIDSLRASTDTSSPLHCPRLQIQPVPPLDDISTQSSQFSDDGYEQLTSSEGYATEHTSDYIEHVYDTETDNSGGLYPPSTTAISMCNAQVNDYVFQKKKVCIAVFS